MSEDNNVKEEIKEFFADEKPDTIETQPVKAQLLVLALVLMGIFATGYLPYLLKNLEGSDALEAETIKVNSDTALLLSEEENIIDPFSNLDLGGKAAFVYDVNTKKVLFTKNPDEQLPLASLTKLMTALVAHEIVENDSEVAISVNAIREDGNSGLTEGEKFALDYLSDFTLIESSNDGAFALAAAAGALLNKDDPTRTFVEAMNIRAEELGLSQTYFLNPTGLDLSETEAGAFGSARDIAFLMEYILKSQPGILERTKEETYVVENAWGGEHEAENTNVVVSEITGLIGSKTGYTTLSGGNLTVAFDASLNRPVVVVVLGSTINGRFSDVLSLVKATKLSLK